MIRYSLICADGHEFESWFASSDAFDALAEQGHLSCVVCGTPKVEKSLMAPAIGRKSNQKSGAAEATPPPLALKGDGGEALKAAKELAAFMDKVRSHVEANAEYVGDNFADEARAIHNKETEMRQIYGEATLEEARDLIEDGVAVAPIPAKRRKSN
ncbi:FIG004851: hypothetical protein [Candidatus Phaeomarinobacter ectocarpi]|uniref:DUF1178 family protein n=1 Tax=Candidatus Phaeomarinibacter ectocarpi TaxID=1458461 RepID=X5MEB1_9HYPH|nr:DUF1178 family protein [Candidatus Phaeomarinobacter ectocarpi]CDO59134.1 FIG004851: hypothetical protein [Candidatus Phaeomarinobacter ectocarpi]